MNCEFEQNFTVPAFKTIESDTDWSDTDPPMTSHWRSAVMWPI